MPNITACLQKKEMGFIKGLMIHSIFQNDSRISFHYEVVKHNNLLPLKNAHFFTSM